jgi:peroxiredoxin
VSGCQAFLTSRRFRYAGGLVLYALAFVLTQGRVARGAGATDPAVATRRLVSLVRSPEVQADLKFDSRQAAEVRLAVAQVDAPLWRLREIPDPKRAEAVRSLQSKFEAELRLILRPEQRHRVGQLLWRAQGVWAAKDARFADRLALTAPQEKQIAKLLGSLDRTTVSVAKATELEAEVMAILTDDQRHRVAEALGPAFDFSRVRQVAVKAPEIVGIEGWINTQPINLADLRGKVVVLHFWTFGCINCVHNLPAYNALHQELPRDKMVIVGIHTPETTSERQFANLQRAAQERELKFPIAMDLKAETWKAWGNSVWPAVYLIDRHGDVRYWWTGELKWQGAAGDKWIRERIEQLIAEKD